MAGLVNYIIHNLQVNSLNPAEAKEALFYIDYLLRTVPPEPEKKRLENFKKEVQERIIYLNALQAKNANPD